MRYRNIETNSATELMGLLGGNEQLRDVDDLVVPVDRIAKREVRDVVAQNSL
jgi:hypothetical protein